ncbi:hypothetical protein CU103_25015 [Phyllobacterium sophorae]|uniref:Uncharacterized protein n=1 Tax=Phyllobacterium sophorae TaxID=1520277 RepID=A0A2P7B2Y9_9HYPH|nr:hypothetical protein CU103_25015 [Phyllobacterium sophorae]
MLTARADPFWVCGRHRASPQPHTSFEARRAKLYTPAWIIVDEFNSDDLETFFALRTPTLLERSVENLWRALRPQPYCHPQRIDPGHSPALRHSTSCFAQTSV